MAASLQAAREHAASRRPRPRTTSRHRRYRSRYQSAEPRWPPRRIEAQPRQRGLLQIIVAPNEARDRLAHEETTDVLRGEAARVPSQTGDGRRVMRRAEEVGRVEEGML